MYRFTNYKFEIFIYEDKFLWNWFEWSSSYDIYYSQNKIWKVWTKEINIPQFQTIDRDQFRSDIFDSMSAMRTHAAFENNFVSILDKHALKKTKILRGYQKPRLNKNLRK